MFLFFKMYLKKFCNFNVILNVFLENKNIIYGINFNLYILVLGLSIYKIKIIYCFG